MMSHDKQTSLFCPQVQFLQQKVGQLIKCKSHVHIHINCSLIRSICHRETQSSDHPFVLQSIQHPLSQLVKDFYICATLCSVFPILKDITNCYCCRFFQLMLYNCITEITMVDNNSHTSKGNTLYFHTVKTMMNIGGIKSLKYQG